MTAKLDRKYAGEHVSPGFCDILEVGDLSCPDVIASAFPKIAALAGVTKKKDKKISKGWISLSNSTLGGNLYNLSVFTGQSVSYPVGVAPKHTAWDGQKQHDPMEAPLFAKLDTKITGLHELFCEVEAMLRTL